MPAIDPELTSKVARVAILADEVTKTGTTGGDGLAQYGANGGSQAIVLGCA
jgi:hypothetical protein